MVRSLCGPQSSVSVQPRVQPRMIGSLSGFMLPTLAGLAPAPGPGGRAPHQRSGGGTGGADGGVGHPRAAGQPPARHQPRHVRNPRRLKMQLAGPPHQLSQRSKCSKSSAAEDTTRRSSSPAESAIKMRQDFRQLKIS
eukprot:1068276-Pyramimonas_sp.AAC.1